MHNSKPDMTLLTAWRTADKGKALRWFLQEPEDGKLLASLLVRGPGLARHGGDIYTEAIHSCVS